MFGTYGQPDVESPYAAEAAEEALLEKDKDQNIAPVESQEELLEF